MYKVRAILDVEEDVIRTLIINENLSLEKLHFDIANAFEFDGKEMASFYRSDEEWNQGEEIPLFNMMEISQGLSMANCNIKEVLLKKEDKLIYVYDFLHMWTFYVELIEISEDLVSETKIILSVGETPKEAPAKVFESNSISNEFDDDFNDPFDDFENLDNLDLDSF